MAALRGSRRLAQVLLRIKIELLFALGTAEVIRLPFEFGSSSGGSRFYVHAAHKIFHSCCILHFHLSFVREYWLAGSSNVDCPISAKHHALPQPHFSRSCGLVRLPTNIPFGFSAALFTIFEGAAQKLPSPWLAPQR
jgi:hypothetical protein